MVKFKEKFSSLYLFMSGSSLRTQTLKQIQAILDEPELFVKELYSIRWLGLKNAVEAVFASYASVLATLARFAEEKNAVAKGLYKYFNSYKVALVTAFILDVHTELGVLSCQLQKQNLLFSEINPLLQGTLAKLENLKTVDGEALETMKERIVLESGEATMCGETIRYSANMDSEFQSLKTEYLNNMRKNMNQRFKKTDVAIFHDLSKVLEPTVVCGGTEADEAVKHLCAFYGYEKMVKVVEGDLIQGVVEQEAVVPKILDPEALEKEWPRLEGMIKGSYSNLSTEQLCKRVILLHSDLLPNFTILAKVALCMQLTSVDCERSFSAQNHLKSKYRASLGSEKLDILLTISMLGPPLQNFQLHRAIAHWLRKQKRKKRLFVQYKPGAKKQKV